MSDIFLSYDSSDRAVAHVFADAFEARGWSVWWDREIPLGKRFDEVIEHELTSAACVIVLWSRESVRSRWVRTEASAAAARECLVPVAIEETAVPLEFRHIQSAMLPGWSGDPSHPEFLRLIEAVEALLRGASAHRSPLPPPAPIPAPRPPRARGHRGYAKLAAAAAAVLILLIVVATRWTRPDGEPSAGNNPVPSTDAPAVTGSPDAAEARPATTSSEAPSPASGSSATSPPSRTVAGAFTLTPSGRVLEDVPGPGAGVIESVGSTDVYVLDARPGQRIYFHMVQATSAIGGARWKLVDAEGMPVFDTCLACGPPGVQRLIRGGRYTLTVGENGTATGAYELRLFEVPPPETFALTIGATVQEDEPSRGAGVIHTPGAEDVFTFTAAPRERLYFRMLEHSPAAGGLRWRLVDSDGTEIFNTCLACGEPGVQRLNKGGEYRLTIGNPTNVGTGDYRLRVTRVPAPQQFALAVPARIGSNAPAAGAGLIEVPGAEDVYVFNAAAGQELRARVIQYDPAMGSLRWRLVDPNGNQVFDTCLACGTPAAQRLSAGGRYELIVGHTTNAGTGAYALALER